MEKGAAMASQYGYGQDIKTFNIGISPETCYVNSNETPAQVFYCDRSSRPQVLLTIKQNSS